MRINKLIPDEAFVYLWQDTRQKSYRYYLGYHKGNPDDSYTHSSSVFESFSKYSIPDGVRRRVIATGSAEEMMELENKLLNNRKDSRKWDRYYNVIASFPPYMWEDPEHREMMSEKMKKQNKKLWADPAFREMKSESSKKLWEDPAFREMKTESSKKQMKKQWEDPAFCEMKSKSTKKQWEDPAFLARQTEKHTCTVCGFVALKRNIVRWHNDNCKHKNPLHELTEDDK